MARDFEKFLNEVIIDKIIETLVLLKGKHVHASYLSVSSLKVG